MTPSLFKATLVVAALAFSAIFCAVVIPAFIAEPDVIAAFGGGFVNPFASGYAADVLMCWVVLVAWIAFEAKTMGIRHGWFCAALGVVPGVAVGFALYLLIRMAQREKLAQASPAIR